METIPGCLNTSEKSFDIQQGENFINMKHLPGHQDVKC